MNLIIENKMYSLINMKNYLFLLLVVMTSCCTNSAKFEITNNSNSSLDSISINPDSDTQFFKLEKEEIIIIKTCLSEVKVDGSYDLRYREKSTNKFYAKNFGYFSNGSQLEKKVLITIEPEGEIVSKSNFYLN